MILLSVALTLAQPTLALDCLAPLSHVQAVLKKEHQVEVRFPEDLMGQVVYLKCQPKPVQEVMERLADSLDCRAVLEEGKWRLERDLARLSQRRRDEAAARRKRLEAQLRELERRGEGKFDEVLKGLMTSSPKGALEPRKTPIGRLMYRLLSDLGADRLAALDPVQQVTYSLEPGANVTAFPGSTRGTLAEFENETRQLGLALSSFPPSLTASHDFTVMAGGSMPDSKAAHLSLTIARWTHMRFSLFVYDSSGRQIGFCPEFLEGDDSCKPDFLGSNAPLSIPPLAARLLPNDQPWSMPKESGHLLWDEMKAEPLAFLAKPLLKQVSEQQSLNLAAALPDGIHEALARRMPRTEKDLCLALAECGVQLAKEGEWLKSRLANQSKLGKLNIDRPALTDFAAHWNETGTAWLRARAVFAYRGGEPLTFSSLDEWLIDHVVSPIRGQFVFSRLLLEHPTTRALGSLDDSAWDRFISGQGVPFPSEGSVGQGLVRGTFGQNRLKSRSNLPLTDVEKNGSHVFGRFGPAYVALRGDLAPVLSLLGGPFGRDPVSLERAAELAALRVERPTEVEVGAFLAGSVTLGSARTLHVDTLFGDSLASSESEPIEGFERQRDLASFGDWPKDLRDKFMSLVRAAHQ